MLDHSALRLPLGDKSSKSHNYFIDSRFVGLQDFVWKATSPTPIQMYDATFVLSATAKPRERHR